MSAGVIIMNRNAIALAADSAVTIGNHLAIHDSANKVFALSKIAPVGVITYASAIFMEIPIEVILKEYKRKLKCKTFCSLEEYFNDFVSFLIKEKQFFRFDKNEQTQIIGLVSNLFDGLNNDLKKLMEDKVYELKRPLFDSEISDLRKSALEMTRKFVDKRSPLPNACFSSYIEKNYRELIKAYIKQNVEGYEDNDYEIMTDIACEVFDKDFFRDGYVGLAFTGYGENDIFPRTIHIRLSSIINDSARYIKIEDPEVSEKCTGCIVPLAQDDVMLSFLKGIHGSFENKIKSNFNSEAENLVQNLDPSIFSTTHKTEINSKLIQPLNDIITKSIDNQSKAYLSPIMSSVATLPIEELALLAESMINITSLRRRVALDKNIDTVGGPIDVAIITKSDGLIWIKRKHFFDKQYNPQYFFSHYLLNSNQEE